MAFFFSTTAYKTAWAMPSRWTFGIRPDTICVAQRKPD